MDRNDLLIDSGCPMLILQEKLNDSLELLNDKLEEVNNQNQPAILLSQVWNTYSRNVRIMLEGLGGLQPPE